VQINGAASVPFLVTVHGIPAGFTGRAVHVVYTDSNGSVTSGDIAF
jgi:hypothetical protein